MPYSKPELNLPEPLEADIGDIDTAHYLNIPIPYQSNASTPLSSAAQSVSSLTDGFRDLSPLQDKRQNQLSSFASSSSSPSLVPSEKKQAAVRPRQLSRSMTFPRVPSQANGKQRKRMLDVDNVTLEPQVVVRMRRWVMGFAIVEFDLDEGPVVDAVFPPFFLLPAETSNIAFSAFPDSPQFDQGTQCHSFRIREQQPLIDYASKRPATLDGYIYGFSHFTQKRDATSKRGYRQRSLVILTQHQFPAFFTSLASTFGPLFQDHGTPMLEAACHNIATWPDPTPGRTTELGFLGTVLHVELPTTADSFQLTETSSFNETFNARLHILASTAPYHPPPILLFEACLTNLWSIWECLVLCEPILVFGQSPAQTSQAIWWLRDLLRPIPLAGDIRPYFTMQDSDHGTLVNRLPPKAGLILGVTNPFFEKSCSHWPHVLSLGKRMSVRTASRMSASNGVVAAGPSPGWKTKTHRRYISKEHNLLKVLEQACQGNDQQKLAASFALRKHFLSRTTSLIAPLQKYLNTLIPSQQEVAKARSLKDTLKLKPFNSSSFLASLKSADYTSKHKDGNLPFKSASKRMQFYERWLKSPSFGVWLAQQESIVESTLNAPISPSASPSLS